MQYVLTDLEAEPDKPSETLETIRAEWATKPLSELYLQEDLGYEAIDFEAWIKRDFNQLRSQYMQQFYIAKDPNAVPNRQLIGQYPDFEAIQICMMLTKAKSKGDKIKILLQAGISGPAHLEAFYAQLTVLTPEELNPILNPNDLISEVALEAQKQLSDYELYLTTGEKPQQTTDPQKRQPTQPKRNPHTKKSTK